MSSFPRSFLKGGISLVFGSNGFSGGRMGKEDGTGVVEIEFSTDVDHREVAITLFDDLSRGDGHYSPVTLSLEQAALLHEWLGYQLRAMPEAEPLTP